MVVQAQELSTQADDLALVNPRYSTLPEGLVSLSIAIGTRDKSESRWQGSFAFEDAEVVRAQLLAPGFGDELEDGKFTVLNREIVAGKSRSISENGLLLTCRPGPHAKLILNVNDKTREFLLSELQWHEPARFWKGAVQITKSLTPYELTENFWEEHFPSMASDRQGRLWLAFVQHEPKGPRHMTAMLERPEDFHAFRPTAGGDRVMVMHHDGASWQAAAIVSESGVAVGRPIVVVAGDGRVEVLWPQQVAGDWELMRAHRDPDSGQWSAPQGFFAAPGTDRALDAVVAPSGVVWVTWQGFRAGNYEIHFGELDKNGLRNSVHIQEPSNQWAPTLAVDSQGHGYLLYDSYEAGNYDLRICEWQDTSLAQQIKKAEPDPVLISKPLVSGADFQARPTAVCDAGDRLWVAWESRPAAWGKDCFGVVGEGPATTLYQDGCQIEFGVWADGQRLATSETMLSAMTDPSGESVSLPTLACDPSGVVWLLYRTHGQRIGHMGTTFPLHAAHWQGSKFSEPLPLARSDYIQDSRPALAPIRGGLVCVSTSDDRVRFAAMNARAANHLVATVLKPIAPNEIPGEVVWMPWQPSANAVTKVQWTGTEHEQQAVQRIREFRFAPAPAGPTLQILRGEFHRHTDLSVDGGEDGSLEDLWRYALDAAQLDWMASSDHDAGGGREFSWWLTQKSTEMQQHEPSFISLFAYERSVSFPIGHRNVLLGQPGIRPLPRWLPPRGPGAAAMSLDDTKLLYEYLRHFDGICVAHTTASGSMGTNWPYHEADVEPLVELYQGCRYNYESATAPRSPAHAEEVTGGVAEEGYVVNALRKGFRLGFAACSDHTSTHVSYTMAYVTEPSRAGIMESLRQRRCYAATDNILLAVTCEGHLMGEEFAVHQPPKLDIHVEGTAPIQSVSILQNGALVAELDANSAVFDDQWQGPPLVPGEVVSLYVRVQQEDGELAWSSPMWIKAGTP